MAKFEVVPDDTDQPRTSDPSAATHLLMLSLKSLSQRAIAAIADLFMLLTVGSVFWLFLSIPSPNTFQLVEMAMYAVFVLAANWIVRR